MKRFAFTLLILLLIPIFNGSSQRPDKIIGIKLYEYDQDFHPLVERWKDMGINAAFLSRELAADTLFRKLLKENDISVWLIFPVFYDPEVLKGDSTLYAITNKGLKAKDDWVEFVCPSRTAFRKMKIEEATKTIRTLQPDGLSVDFIRQFVFWEMIYPDRTPESIDRTCFCDSCIAGFIKKQGLIMPEIYRTAEKKAAFILKNFESSWNDYRCDLIASMVKDIAEKTRSIKPGLKINIHAVPWGDSDFGGANLKVAAQDLKKIAPYADLISPMCYSQMVKRDADWISAVVAEMDGKAPGMILPSIQVYPYYIEDPFSADDFRKCVNAALQEPSRGVVFFSWPLFEKDPVRMNLGIRE